MRIHECYQPKMEFPRPSVRLHSSAVYFACLATAASKQNARPGRAPPGKACGRLVRRRLCLRWAGICPYPGFILPLPREACRSPPQWATYATTRRVVERRPLLIRDSYVVSREKLTSPRANWAKGIRRHASVYTGISAGPYAGPRSKKFESDPNFSQSPISVMRQRRQSWVTTMVITTMTVTTPTTGLRLLPWDRLLKLSVERMH